MNTLSSQKPLRNSSVDVLKIISFALVVCVHFCAHSGFMTEVHTGKTMYVLNLVYAFSYVCVALFIMTSGYLMTNKKLSVSYYKGVIRVVIMYILCSIVCLSYKAVFYDYTISLKSWLLSILGFTASDYGWYVEMYLGLFILIPFLNAAYHGMDSKQKKLILVLSTIVLTALPGVFNTFNFQLSGWWKQPSVSNQFQKLIPGWWSGFYPVTYYFIGSYLREYPPKIKKRYLALLWLVFGIISGSYNFYRFFGGTFFYGAFSTNASLFNLLTATSLFSFITSIDLRSIQDTVKKIIAFTAKCTFSAYLLSAIVDIHVYPRFRAIVPDLSRQYRCAPIIVLIVFSVSLSLSAILNAIYDLTSHTIKKMRN